MAPRRPESSLKDEKKTARGGISRTESQRTTSSRASLAVPAASKHKRELPKRATDAIERSGFGDFHANEVAGITGFEGAEASAAPLGDTIMGDDEEIDLDSITSPTSTEDRQIPRITLTGRQEPFQWNTSIGSSGAFGADSHSLRAGSIGGSTNAERTYESVADKFSDLFTSRKVGGEEDNTRSIDPNPFAGSGTQFGSFTEGAASNADSRANEEGPGIQ